tara:strand:+ start:5826 stop:6041 length:216 start_codon:yes stop_codon:yes gene_type:complete
MAVTRYVGDKLVGLDSEKDAVILTVSNGATYYCTDSPYNVYIKVNSVWQQCGGLGTSGTSGSSGSSGTSGS